MNNYKIKVNGTHPLEYQDILDIASELGYANEDWGNLYNVNYLFLNDDGSVGFSLNGESVSDDYQEITLPQLRDLVAQSKPTEQGLISGADALRALADGKEVEHKANSHMPWGDASLIAAKLFLNTSYQFRLKPSTIKLSLEIAAPFDPKEGEIFWFVSPYTYKGYDSKYFVDDCTGFLLNGVWRTEEEIKQVVAALRGGIKG